MGLNPGHEPGGLLALPWGQGGAKLSPTCFGIYRPSLIIQPSLEQVSLSSWVSSQVNFVTLGSHPPDQVPREKQGCWPRTVVLTLGGAGELAGKPHKHTGTQDPHPQQLNPNLLGIGSGPRRSESLPCESNLHPGTWEAYSPGLPQFAAPYNEYKKFSGLHLRGHSPARPRDLSSSSLAP